MNDNDKERIDTLRQKLLGRGPVSHDDLAFALDYADRQARRAAELEKNVRQLAAQVMELNQEMENVRSDFGGGNLR